MSGRTAAKLIAFAVLAGCGAGAHPGSPGGTGATGMAVAGGMCSGRGTMVETTAPFGPQTADAAVVYLPACYHSDPARRFPVLYLLHGASADETQWPDVGIAAAADALIGAGSIGPLIIVMPDGGRSLPDSIVDQLAARLVPWTDRTYRTLPERSRRAIGGISRGGRIALFAAAAAPELFQAVGGHSPAVDGTDVDAALVAGLRRFGADAAIDIGDHDPLSAGVQRFTATLFHEGVNVRLQRQPGRHDRSYWRDHTTDYLRFYGAALAEN